MTHLNLQYMSSGIAAIKIQVVAIILYFSLLNIDGDLFTFPQQRLVVACDLLDSLK